MKAAVNMYRANDMWDDAIRVATLHGGASATAASSLALTGAGCRLPRGATSLPALSHAAATALDLVQGLEEARGELADVNV